MTFLPARPVKTAPKTTGISFSTRNHQSERAEIFITAGAQQEHFGETIIGWHFKVLVGRGEDEGKLLLEPLAEGKDPTPDAIKANKGIRSGAKIAVAVWDLLGPVKTAGMPCKVLDFSERGLLIELPDWCTPENRKRREMGAGKPRIP
jgi:hypothetical protein